MLQRANQRLWLMPFVFVADLPFDTLFATDFSAVIGAQVGNLFWMSTPDEANRQKSSMCKWQIYRCSKAECFFWIRISISSMINVFLNRILFDKNFEVSILAKPKTNRIRFQAIFNFKMIIKEQPQPLAATTAAAAAARNNRKNTFKSIRIEAFEF